MAGRRATDQHAAALYIREKEQGHRQLRIYLPEERVGRMRGQYQIEEWDGVARMRVVASWINRPSILGLKFVTERSPKGVGQTGNALILERTEGAYYVSFGTQDFVKGLEPFGATVCEDVTWFDDGVSLELCPHGAPYEPRQLKEPRRSVSNAGVPRAAEAKMPLAEPPPPSPWDVNLLGLLGWEEHPAMMDLRAGLGLVREATDRMTKEGWKVQLSLMSDGTPRVTAYPAVLAKFISLPRWQAIADNQPVLDTNVTIRSLPSGAEGPTVAAEEAAK